MGYYSGQGVVYYADRNTDGTPKGFLPLGNVPSLELSVEITKFEHTESMSGQRATDLTIVQEKKGTFTMTMEDTSPRNLALAFWGAYEAQAAGTLSDLVVVATVDADLDMRVPIADYSTGDMYTGLSGVTVGDDATPTTAYEFGTSEGDAGSLNGWVDEANGVLVIYSSAKQTSKGAANSITNGQDLYIDATGHGASEITHAFTKTSQQKWLRFQGLNTITDTPVMIDIFKADLDPLSGYALINEELSSFEVTGSVLYDELQAGTSKFFRQITV